MSDYEFLQISTTANVASVTLNRPDKANALHRALWSEIKHFFEWVTDRREIHAIVISGRGKHFCAGMDLHFLRDIQQEFSEAPANIRQSKLKEFIVDLQNSFNAIERCEKPVIAAIHGQCIGGGLDLISACDIRYASVDARFSIKEVDLGIVADTGSLQRLPHMISHGVLCELAYTGREFSAQEAKEMGMVNECFTDPASLEAHAFQIAKIIANKNTLTVRGIKESLLYARDQQVSDSLAQVAAWNAKALAGS